MDQGDIETIDKASGEIKLVLSYVDVLLLMVYAGLNLLLGICLAVSFDV